jgi:lipopolysaccharide biosynthesis glycosyltransferase
MAQAMIDIFIGYDPREAVAYHVFCQSLIDKASQPLALHPLALEGLREQYVETHHDGSNAFIYSRFLVPHMMGFKGWAVFADGDMVCTEDIVKLWSLRDETKAVQVVKHDYQTKEKRKYIGTSMETHNIDYPRKNWSSVILWNCGHVANSILTPGYVMDSSGSTLHRFKHLSDDLIGELPKEWNWLSQEQGAKPDAALIHYTLGIPAIAHYKECPQAEEWHKALCGAMHVQI